MAESTGSIRPAYRGRTDPVRNRRLAPLRAGPYHEVVQTRDDDTWVGLQDSPLPVEEASQWVVRADCGAVVVFSGTARDHSEGRDDVSVLEYEAYEEEVLPRLASLATATRQRWADVGRIAMIHRVGAVPIGESAVVVAVAAPHRDSAFLAARFCIDSLKATVPIWKRETWRDGESWGLEAQHLREIAELDHPDDADRATLTASGEVA